jgi:hypothetical protein
MPKKQAIRLAIRAARQKTTHSATPNRAVKPALRGFELVTEPQKASALSDTPTLAGRGLRPVRGPQMAREPRPNTWEQASIRYRPLQCRAPAAGEGRWWQVGNWQAAHGAARLSPPGRPPTLWPSPALPGRDEPGVRSGRCDNSKPKSAFRRPIEWSHREGAFCADEYPSVSDRYLLRFPLMCGLG